MSQHVRGGRAGALKVGLAGFLVALSTAVTANVAQAQAPPPPPPGAQLERDLNDAAGGRGRLARHGATGQLRFFGTTRDHPVGRGRDIARDAAPEAAARSFLVKYGSLFGADDQARQLKLDKAKPADAGRSSVRFQQVHDGVPVFGGDLIVNLDKDRNVLSVNGELLPGLAVGTTPKLSAADAQAKAVEAIAKERDVEAGALAASDASLWIYNPILVGPGAPHSNLVWRTEVTSNDDEMRELVLVDAQTGVVRLHFDQVAHGKVRHVCDRNNVVNPDETCVAPSARDEGQPATGNVQVDRAYDYSGHVYDYFFSTFGRNSIDNAGMPLVSIVRFCDDEDCPYANASWTGSTSIYGDGILSDDIVAHEFTHGITQHEANLFYWAQSGAINESFSDLFGELIDLGNGAGTDTAAVRWAIAEDAAEPPSAGATPIVGPIRDMANPPRFNHADSMASPLYYVGTDDGGGVHWNSGVNNKAAFLLTDGGSFNGVTVRGLGATKVGHIYYEALTNLLTSGSDYQDLYEVLQQACFNKTGVAGLTTADCGEVKKAVTATKMNQPAPGGTALEVPICESGDNPVDLFFDNMENSAPNWVFAGTGGGGWGFATDYATSAVRNLRGRGAAAANDHTARRAAAVVPPTGKLTYLRFNHDYDMETDHDGGVVEYSTNGGTTWTDAGPLFVDNGYNATNPDGPFAGRGVFTGVSLGYGSSRLDLSSLAGANVLLRFRVAGDALNESWGWDIDDVRVYSCGAPAPGLAIDDVTVVEGNTGTRPVTFTVSRSGELSQPASVTYATANATATAGSDFTAIPTTVLNFGAGESSKTVTVNVTGDTAAEANEAFTVNLSAPSGATLADTQGVATIVNDEIGAMISVADLNVPEGNAGTSAAAFTITRSGPTGGTSTVRYATTPGTATAGADYLSVAAATITFNPGETTKTAPVTINGDTVPEAGEDFTITLSSVTGATLLDTSAVGVITNDDAGLPARLSIADVTLNEGNAGTAAATFTVKRSGATTEAVSVNVVTANSTATAGSDYTAVSTTVNFTAGDVTKTVAVNVTGEVVDESNEAFLVNLSAPVKAVIEDGQAVGTVVDDDGPITPGPATFLGVADVSLNEGNAGVINATFTITRSGSTAGTSSVVYRTLGGTAIPGVDYVTVPPTAMNFAAAETTKTFTVQFYGDTVPENSEQFSVLLTSPVGAVIADATAAGVISNDDSGMQAQFVVDNLWVAEGHSGSSPATFTVSRLGSSAEAVSVNFATANGSAGAGTDYVANSGTLSFAAGESAKTVTVAVSGDTAIEGHESLLLNLSSPVGAVIADGQGHGTILNDDDPPLLSVNDILVAEGSTGPKTVTFTISRRGDTSGTSSVTVATSPGTATAGTDYVSVPSTVVSFAAGQSAKTANATIKGDSAAEPNETFNLVLSAAVGSRISDATGVATIVNDD